MTHRTLIIGLGVIAAVVATPHGAAAQSPPTTVVDLAFSTAPMERTASVISAGVATVSRAGDAVLLSIFPERARARDTRGAMLRFAKLALLDFPVAHYADGLNHEFGHLSRGGENGLGLELRLTGGPWSQHQFDLHTTRSQRLDLASIGGGFDAELTRERRLWDRAYEENLTSVADAMTVVDGAIGRFYYVHHDLAAIGGRVWDDIVYDAGDPRRYVYELVGRRFGYYTTDTVLATAGAVRARAWLNFADVGMWAQAWNIARYVLRGDASFQQYRLRVGAVGVAPFSQYHLSPLGPQLAIGSRYGVSRSTGEFFVRWTEPIQGIRLVGAGFSWSRASGPSGAVVQPRLRVDVWRGPAPATGMRLEVGATAARWPSRRARLQLAVGAKSAGYVLGLPEKAGGYLQAGLRLKF